MNKQEDKKRQGLEWRDYVAIASAALQTTLLPMVVFILVLVLVLFLFRP